MRCCDVMRVLVPILLTLLPSCRENKQTPVVSDPAPTTSKPAPSSSNLAKPTTITLAPSTIDGAVAFEIAGGGVTALALAVDCPKAPTGCALKPDVLAGKPNDLPSLKCAGGRLVSIGLKAPWAKVAPGKYSSTTALVPDVAVSYHRDGKVVVANDWTGKDPETVVTIDEVTPTSVRGSVHARLGDLVVDGPFQATFCPATP